jgi:hypothetical protein
LNGTPLIDPPPSEQLIDSKPTLKQNLTKQNKNCQELLFSHFFKTVSALKKWSRNLEKGDEEEEEDEGEDEEEGE